MGRSWGDSKRTTARWRGEEGAVEGDGAGAELELELELGFKAKKDGVERRHSALPPFPA